MEWHHHEEIFNNLRFHAVSQGEGPLLLLLHGFPEFWYSWRYQLPALAAAGYRAVAPDLRGYNLSEKPPGVAAYHINHLVDDVVAMLERWGDDGGSVLVGHDWGGVIAWYVASRFPHLVRKLAILNAPHPNRYLEVARSSARQRLNSTYIFLFQLPWLPERLLTMADGMLVARMFRTSGADPRTFTPADAARYRMAFTRPGAATAALNYYRSMVRRTVGRLFQHEPVRVTVPTLLLWGRNDVALAPANAEPGPLRRWVPDLRVHSLEASHWIQMDAPELVNARLLEFIEEA